MKPCFSSSRRRGRGAPPISGLSSSLCPLLSTHLRPSSPASGPLRSATINHQPSTFNRGRQAARGFTLVELLIGMSLALIVMSAVLSSYAFLGRNLTRLANQHDLETSARRAQGYFAQDARMASDVSNPTSTSLTFDIPAATGTTTVSYSYYTSATTVGGVSIPAYSLARRTPASSGTPLILVRDIVPLSFAFKYYDASGTEYTTPTSANYRLGLKQVSFSYIARTGSGVNGTLTRNYTAESPRFALRNKALLP